MASHLAHSNRAIHDSLHSNLSKIHSHISKSNPHLSGIIHHAGGLVGNIHGIGHNLHGLYTSHVNNPKIHHHHHDNQINSDSLSEGKGDQGKRVHHTGNHHNGKSETNHDANVGIEKTSSRESKHHSSEPVESGPDAVKRHEGNVKSNEQNSQHNSKDHSNHSIHQVKSGSDAGEIEGSIIDSKQPDEHGGFDSSKDRIESSVDHRTRDPVNHLHANQEESRFLKPEKGDHTGTHGEITNIKGKKVITPGLAKEEEESSRNHQDREPDTIQQPKKTDNDQKTAKTLSDPKNAIIDEKYRSDDQKYNEDIAKIKGDLEEHKKKMLRDKIHDDPKVRKLREQIEAKKKRIRDRGEDPNQNQKLQIMEHKLESRKEVMRIEGIDNDDPDIKKYEKQIQERTEGHHDIVKLKGELDAKRKTLIDAAFNDDAKTKEIQKRIADRKYALSNSGKSEDGDEELNKMKSELEQHRNSFEAKGIDDHPEIKDYEDRIQQRRYELEENTGDTKGKKLTYKEWLKKNAGRAKWVGGKAAQASLLASKGAAMGIGGVVGGISASSRAASATAGATGNGVNMAMGGIHDGIQSGIGAIGGGGSVSAIGAEQLASMRPSSLFGGGGGGLASYQGGYNSDNDSISDNSDPGNKKQIQGNKSDDSDTGDSSSYEDDSSSSESLNVNGDDDSDDYTNDNSDDYSDDSYDSSDSEKRDKNSDSDSS